MKRLAFRGAGTLVIAALALAACSGATRNDAVTAAHQYGWMHAIASYNTLLPVGTRLGKAQNAIEGHSIRDIINDPDVRIRGDDRPCVDCHAWAADIDKHDFCATHIDAFLAEPTATGSGDPPSAKPLILKELLAVWKARGCPD